MSTCAGIDLGSTTTKAVLVDQDGQIVGQGITNSRSSYEVACAVALEEARLGAALNRIGSLFAEKHALAGREVDLAARTFYEATRLALHRRQLAALRGEIESTLDRPEQKEHRAVLEPAVTRVLDEMEKEAAPLFAPGAGRRSDFFRDVAGEQFLSRAEKLSAEGVPFERLVGLYDRAVLAIETQLSMYEPASLLRSAWDELPNVAPAALRPPARDEWTSMTEAAAAFARLPDACVGTGYGRQTLPFDPAAVRSEILCHGRGAHHFFPGTRTVLDIGGQDTKAIQVDEGGVVTAFQMNDRCAAGCGRYLGYIADELGLGLHELGPLALQAKRMVRVNSTCTVFAGAELRDRLALGERREDILLGLHRAIVLRALSLLSRAGGVKDQFTFTGGVSKNPAVVKLLDELVRESFGKDLTINIHADSIYMGALGASLFALDDLRSGKKYPQPRFLEATAAAAAQPVRAPVKAKAPLLKVASIQHHEEPVDEQPATFDLPAPGPAGERGLTAGVDVGASSVKVAIVESDGGSGSVLTTVMQRIRRRAVVEVSRAAFREACERAGVNPAQLRYVASTGDGDGVPFRTGHFYSMTAHARGALLLVPDAAGALDMGALHARAIRMDGRARVLGVRMTSQCASGTGQFLENVARYLGVPLEDVGALSKTATAPEQVSSVCAVLSETDVINLVSRGVAAADILMGIHQGIAVRLARLVGSAKVEGVIALTGGLALDAGLVSALSAEFVAEKRKVQVELRAHPQAQFAGAIGAALLGALRHRQLSERAKAG
ncbi:MAG TPA: BadF/BadG/BcrA/BcrD ATPase family protein [Myxococcales bacterium]|nr:BadF/BadG/BcrA/BcrD ATPase family protein [Myxococcales bacterium]